MCGSKGTTLGGQGSTLTGTSGTSTGTTLPASPQTADFYNQVLSQASALGQTPFNPATLTSWTPSQEQAIEAMFNVGVNVPQALGVGLSGPQEQAFNELWTSGRQAGQWDPSVIQAIMSPYIQNVVNATQAQFNNQNAIQGNQLIGQAIRSGNIFGGDRAGVAAAQLAGQQQLAQAPVIAGLYQSGYGQALNQYNALRQGGLQGALAAFGGANAIAANPWQRAAQSMALMGQGLQAAGLPAQIAQQNAIQQSAYPFQIANWLASIGAGVGPLTGTTGTGTQTGFGTSTPPPPNPITQGLGIGALGLSGLNAIGGLGGLASLFALSDERAKTDIQRAGTDRGSGLPLYAYRYKGDPKTYPKVVGPMAQDVARVHPEAVVALADGGRIPLARVINGVVPHLQEGGGFGTPYDAIVGLGGSMAPRSYLGVPRIAASQPLPLIQMPDLSKLVSGSGAGKTSSSDPSGVLGAGQNFVKALGGAKDWLTQPTSPGPTEGGTLGPAIYDSPAGPFMPSGLGGATDTTFGGGLAYGTGIEFRRGGLTGYANGGDADDDPEEGPPYQVAGAPVASGRMTWFNPRPYTYTNPDTGETLTDTSAARLGEGYHASRLPISTPGIALSRQDTLGQPLVAILPDGRRILTRQTDIGPPGVVDVNAALATRLYPGQGGTPGGNIRVERPDPSDLEGRTALAFAGDTGADSDEVAAVNAAARGRVRTAQAAGLPPNVTTIPGFAPRPRTALEEWAASPLARAGAAMLGSRSPYFGEGLSAGVKGAMGAIEERYQADVEKDKPTKMITTEDGSIKFFAPGTGKLIDMNLKGKPTADTRVPSGYRWNKDKTALEPIPGGPHDPEVAKTKGDKIPSGYRLSKDGETLEYIPGGPADPEVMARSATAKGEAKDIASEFDPETIRFMAEQYALHGDKSILQNLRVLGARNVKLLRAEIMKVAKEHNLKPGDVTAKIKDLEAAGAAAKTQAIRSSNIETAIEEVKATMPLGVQASEALARTKYVPWNQLVQMVQRGTSNPQLNTFFTANQAIITAYAAAINRGANVTTVDARHAAEALLSTVTSHESYMAVLDQMWREMQAAKAAPDAVRAAIMGRISGREKEAPADTTTEPPWKTKQAVPPNSVPGTKGGVRGWQTPDGKFIPDPNAR